MILSPAPDRGASLMMVEGCLTAIAIALAFALPRLGSRAFSGIERRFTQLARRKKRSVAVVGITAFLLRLAVLPWCPIPHPFIQDDFSFLLAADTFAHGRLANPTPALWHHFETVHVSMVPTYQSMYFPAQGMVLAAGKLLTGHAWFGLLVVTALMCSALCWMLQAWLPPTWALLGGFLVVLRLALFSCWINTYSGAGSITTLGGALVLGALPRFIDFRDSQLSHSHHGPNPKHHPRPTGAAIAARTAMAAESRIRLDGQSLRDGIFMAIGVVLLGISRPYEGALLCVPVAVILIRWAFFGKKRPSTGLLARRTALPLLLILTGCAWMGYYNNRAFGSPLTPPYKLNRAQYAVAPYYVWQSPRPQPVYRHPLMQKFYTQVEFHTYQRIHNLRGFLPQTLIKALRTLYFYAGIALLPPLIMMRRVFLDRRVRFLIIATLVLAAGMAVEIYLIPYYVAPFTAAFYAIGLQCMRHLRLWKPGDHAVGRALVRYTVTLCVLLAGVRVFAAPLHIRLATSSGGEWAAEWYGPPPSSGAARAAIQSQLNHLPGKQLVIVRYSPVHNPTDEWVYNRADIDKSKIIWARDMGPAENLDLIRYYKDRTAWLVQPDTAPPALTPYPGAGK